MLVARDLPRDRALAKVRLTPAPPVRNYASVPQLPSQGQSFGGRGAGAGEFQEPRGLAIDPDGNLLVADSQNNRIQKLDRSGKPLATWGGISPGDGPRQFRTPCGVTVGSDGSIYVADTWNHRIQKLSAKGDFVLQWREEDPGLWGPRAIVAAPDGSIFVADTGNKRILAYDPGGQRLLSFGSEGNNDRQFIEPVGLAIDPQTKTLYVADTGNHRVQFFGLDGTFQGKWTVYGWEEFYTEPYLAWHAGALWATDSFNRRVNAYEAGGNLLKSIGDQSGSGDLAHPIGVAVSSSGEVFVSDTMNHRILVFADPLASR
jgi:DNA-binding beta-propeller fold protein YncE